MPPPKRCLENIEKRRGNYCGDEVCKKFAKQIQEYCRHVGLPPESPIPLYVDGALCFCCCGMDESKEGEPPKEEAKEAKAEISIDMEEPVEIKSWKKKCLENIAKLGGQYCGDIFCEDIQSLLDKYCEESGLTHGIPVPQIKDGKFCYCCCGPGALEGDEPEDI